MQHDIFRHPLGEVGDRDAHQRHVGQGAIRHQRIDAGAEIEDDAQIREAGELARTAASTPRRNAPRPDRTTHPAAAARGGPGRHRRTGSSSAPATSFRSRHAPAWRARLCSLSFFRPSLSHRQRRDLPHISDRTASLASFHQTRETSDAQIDPDFRLRPGFRLGAGRREPQHRSWPPMTAGRRATASRQSQPKPRSRLQADAGPKLRDRELQMRKSPSRMILKSSASWPAEGHVMGRRGRRIHSGRIAARYGVHRQSVRSSVPDRRAEHSQNFFDAPVGCGHNRSSS